MQMGSELCEHLALTEDDGGNSSAQDFSGRTKFKYIANRDKTTAASSWLVSTSHHTYYSKQWGAVSALGFLGTLPQEGYQALGQA